MKRGTQRAIYTVVWLGALAGGAVFLNRFYGPQIRGALDTLFGSFGQTPASGQTLTSGTTAESIYADAERMDAAPSPQRFNSMFDQLIGFKNDVLRALAPDTVNAVTGPTGDPSSDVLLRQMFADLKDYDAGMISYLTYLQGEYLKPGAGGTGASGFSRGTSYLAP